MRFSTRSVRGRHGRAAGYSLAEVVVSLAVFIAILLGVLFIFNLNYRLARGRGDTAQRQAALRGAQHDLVRLIDMAGGGGLPDDLAISVRNNAAPGSRIGGPGSPRVVAGTDVLTVRGVFSAPLYRVGAADGSLRLGGAAGPTRGLVEIRDPSPQTGVSQDLTELAAAAAAGPGAADALLLVSQLDESVFAVVGGELGAATVSREGGRVSSISLGFDSAAVPATLAGAGAAAALRGAAFVGILEEYRIYVRAAFAAPGDESSAPRPQLAMARFVPGTDEPWGGTAASLGIDLADDVSDLQVALGFDTDGDGSVSDGPAGGEADEWLFDDPGDDPGDPRWNRGSATLALVRLTTVARASAAEAASGALEEAPLEDRPAGQPFADGWRLRSMVDLESDRVRRPRRSPEGLLSPGSEGSRPDRAPPPGAARSGS